jgi:hypothetical protein
MVFIVLKFNALLVLQSFLISSTSGNDWYFAWCSLIPDNKARTLPLLRQYLAVSTREN